MAAGMAGLTRLVAAALLAVIPLSACAPLHTVEPDRWVTIWGSAQQVPEPHNALPPGALDDATLRQLVRTTIAGHTLRLRLSNAFGTAPLAIGGVNVAIAPDPALHQIDPARDRSVTFVGSRTVTIPAGAEYVSDPVQLNVPALATLAVSIHFPEEPARQTGHPGSRATSYVARGAQLSAPDLPGATPVDHWYQLAAVDVLAPPEAGAVVVLGDSITDGFGVKPNTNTRWTDFLAERLQANAATRSVAVVNAGLGGNRLLKDGLGPNLAARFERDVLARSGVTHLILLEGVNDLGGLTRERAASPAEHRALVGKIIAAYAQIVAKARERGIQAIGATILPYGGSNYYHPDAANEADRQAINAWIRRPGNFDAVIDFDAAMRDPARPDRLHPDYDSGDGLHPSIVGYRAMAAAVPLSLFERP